MGPHNYYHSLQTRDNTFRQILHHHLSLLVIMTKSYNLGFIIEQALGHVTHTKNLQANLPKHTDVTPHWALPVWQKTGLASKIPVYKSNWTLQASLQARRMIGQIQRQTKLDALFFHTQVTGVLAQNWVRQIPSIISLDATPLQYDSLGQFYSHESGPEWLEQFKWRLNRDLFASAKQIVTWSAWAKQGVVDEYEVSPDKVTVIPPGVNIDEWTRPTPRSQTAPDRVKILFVGGNLERKGGFILLDAFRALRTEAERGDIPAVELHLATRDTLDPEPGLFVYNDMQPNSAPLKKLYHDSDIFCLPTYGDCLPMVLSEAGAAGLPMVSTDVAAIPELVLEDKTGYIVPTGDVTALRDALRKLVTDHATRHAHSSAAISAVAKNYSAADNAKQLIELLKTTADAGI